MYAKVINGVVTYPYTRAMFRADNPDTSIGDAVGLDIAEFNVVAVAPAAQPAYDPMTQSIAEGTPADVLGVWTQQWVVSALDPAVIAEKQAAADLAAADLAAQEDAKAEPIVTYMLTHTAQEIKDKINTDVTDLASAKLMLGRFGVALAYLARQGLR